MLARASAADFIRFMFQPINQMHSSFLISGSPPPTPPPEKKKKKIYALSLAHSLLGQFGRTESCAGKIEVRFCPEYRFWERPNDLSCLGLFDRPKLLFLIAFCPGLGAERGSNWRPYIFIYIHGAGQKSEKAAVLSALAPYPSHLDT